MEIKTIEEFKAFVENKTWTFAKTMAYNPHFWTVRNSMDFNTFNSAVGFIFEHGKEVRFGSSAYITLDCGNYYYWTCERKDESGNYVTYVETNLINRAVRRSRTNEEKEAKIEEAKIEHDKIIKQLTIKPGEWGK